MLKLLIVLLVAAMCYSHAPGIYIPVDSVFIYENPNLESDKVAKVHPGIKLYLLNRTQRFFYVEADGNLGWIQRANVKEYYPKEAVEKTDRVILASQNDTVFIRDGHDRGADIVATITSRHQVLQYSSYLDWRKVVLEDNRIGWVENRHLVNFSPERHRKTTEEIIEKYEDYFRDLSGEVEQRPTTTFGHKPVRNR